MKQKIHMPAVLASAAARFTIGAVWTPLLFAGAWIEYTGWTQAQEEIAQDRMALTFAVAFFSYVVQACVLAMVVDLMNARSVIRGAWTGVLVWLGFTLVILLQDSLFELRPLGLFGIKAGYELVSLVVMGAILAVWRKRPVAE